MNSMLKDKVEELAKRNWDSETIKNSFYKLKNDGIPRKKLNGADLIRNKEKILNRVQQRAEEYNFIMGNCAASTATALMEEFGLGNIEITKALLPFPGFGATGWMCGGVTGSLIALGLFFGSEDALDFEAVGAAMGAARKFMSRFIETTGSPICPDLQKSIVFGKYMDAGASQENMGAFVEAKGFEKCGVFPGEGARIAAQIIIESFEE